jgi:hypothetical protein
MLFNVIEPPSPQPSLPGEGDHLAACCGDEATESSKAVERSGCGREFPLLGERVRVRADHGQHIPSRPLHSCQSPARSQEPVLGFALLLVLLGATTTATAETIDRRSSWQIRFVAEPPHRVQVTGPSSAKLRQLRQLHWSPEQWEKLFAVHAEQGDLTADIGLPPMAGDYRVEGDVLLFLPRFPFAAGVTYRATFHPSVLPGKQEGVSTLLTETFRLERRSAAPTSVRHVYPSADELPENLLKFYVHFSAPMSRGHIYDHIQLLDEQRKPIELPFLEIDEELWDVEMKRLTLFIDPGRIKRGVRPLEEVGPSLEHGKRYSLVIDKGWHDAQGNGLSNTYEKRFTVGAPDRTPPDPKEWQIAAPSLTAGTTRLEIRFPDPMDHALALRLIRVERVRGDRGALALEGTATLEDDEKRWAFAPSQPWQRGKYHVVVPAIIEDLAGNNIGKPFEVDLFDTIQTRPTNAVTRVPFEVR